MRRRKKSDRPDSISESEGLWMMWCWGQSRAFKKVVTLDLALERHKENCRRKAHRWQTWWVGNQGVLPGWAERKGAEFSSWLMMMGRTSTETNFTFLRPPPGSVFLTVLPDITESDRNARVSTTFWPAVLSNLPWGEGQWLPSKSTWCSPTILEISWMEAFLL